MERRDYIVSPAWFPKDLSNREPTQKNLNDSSETKGGRSNYVVSPAWAPRTPDSIRQRNSEAPTSVETVTVLIGGEKIVFPMVG